MDEMQPGLNPESPVTLEINVSHRYKADEMGVIELRVRNQGTRMLRILDLIISDCPCERSKTKTVSLKSLMPAAEKKPLLQFEPARGGEAVFRFEIKIEDENRLPWVFRGETWVTISSKNEGSTSNTSFNIEFNDVQKFMGNDLSGLLAGAGREKVINEELLQERMKREPFWMRVDLDLDEEETVSRRLATRRLIAPAPDQMPARSARALLESLDPAAPHRAFFFSMPEVVFGREADRSDAVLLFLPDGNNDARSKTISAEQFVVRCRGNECTLSMAPNGHALMAVNHKLVGPEDKIPIAGGTQIKIGPCEFTLQITCAPRTEDAKWKDTREEILRFDPGSDPFEASPWDLVSFARPTNGQEEEYLWLMRRIEIGWAVAGTGLQLGRPGTPRARLAFWCGRYYLEALQGDAEIKIGGLALQSGKIACLEAEKEIWFGPHRFQWRLL